MIDEYTLPLWNDDFASAFEADVHAAGGMKRVGKILWPAMEADEAGKKLRRTLLKQHKQKLSEEEKEVVLVEAAKHGSRCTAAYYARLASAKLVPSSPEDEKREIVERYEQARRGMAELMKTLAEHEKRHGLMPDVSSLKEVG